MTLIMEHLTAPWKAWFMNMLGPQPHKPPCTSSRAWTPFPLSAPADCTYMSVGVHMQIVPPHAPQKEMTAAADACFCRTFCSPLLTEVQPKKKDIFRTSPSREFLFFMETTLILFADPMFGMMHQQPTESSTGHNFHFISIKLLLLVSASWKFHKSHSSWINPIHINPS